jgi:hypothetical protein
MIERKHLRIVRAVQRVVAAAKELADAEKALRRRASKTTWGEQGTTQVGARHDARGATSSDSQEGGR